MTHPYRPLFVESEPSTPRGFGVLDMAGFGFMLRRIYAPLTEHQLRSRPVGGRP